LIADQTDGRVETIAQRVERTLQHKTMAGPRWVSGTKVRSALKKVEGGDFARHAKLPQWAPDDGGARVRDNARQLSVSTIPFNVCFKVATAYPRRPWNLTARQTTDSAGHSANARVPDSGEAICTTDVFCFAPTDTRAGNAAPGC